MNIVRRKGELAFWSVFPTVLACFFILFQLSPKYATGLGMIMPHLHMGVMFYWMIFRPRIMPFWVLALLGVLYDSLTGLPLGSSSLLYVALFMLLLSQIRHVYKEGFLVKWSFFAASMLAFTGLQWLLMLAIMQKAYPLGAPLLQWVMTVACYPFVHLLCDRLAAVASMRRWHLQHMK